MRRFIAASAALLLLLLASQAVLAQYEPSGSLTVSPSTVNAGSDVSITGGSGFAPESQVLVTISPDPALLATVTTDATGGFTVAATIPSTYTGSYTITATGVDSAGSVYVLTAGLTVIAGEVKPAQGTPAPGSSEMPATSQIQGDLGRGASDPIVLAMAGAGIVAMTGAVLLVVTRRRRMPN